MYKNYLIYKNDDHKIINHYKLDKNYWRILTLILKL